MATREISLRAVLAVAIVGVLCVWAASLLMAYQRIPNTGDVKAVGVGVYWDSECTNNVTAIDWGFLEPGATSNVMVYIQNEGNMPVMLNMTTDNWSPLSASNYIMLDWSCEGYVLDSGYAVQAVLTLFVSSNITEVTSFSFDIVITGTEYA